MSERGSLIEMISKVAYVIGYTEGTEQDEEKKANIVFELNKVHNFLLDELKEVMQDL